MIDTTAENAAPLSSETDAADNADVLHAADAWQVEGFSVWNALKFQIAAEMPQPEPVRTGVLGRALYETGLADAVQRARAEADRVPTVDLTRHAAEPNAVAVLPAEIARKNNALPIRKVSNKLWVVMKDHRDIIAVDDIRRASRCHVIPLIAVPPGVFEAAFSAAYPAAPVAFDADDTTTAELVQRVRDLKNEVSLLRQEVEALKQQAALDAASAARRRGAPKPIPATPRRSYPTPLFPLATPADFPPFGLQ